MRGLHLEPGMRVGILGGSFDPAHEGHLFISRLALRHLGLSRVIWLVAQRNPLKPRAGVKPFAVRLAGARAQARGDPAIVVSDFEDRIQGGRTARVLAGFCARHRQLRAVWLMGADVMADFALWHRWEEVAARIPIAIFPRPGSIWRARRCRPAQVLARHWLDPADSRLLPFLEPPALCFLHTPVCRASSSARRGRGGFDPPPVAV